ncbi:MAG: type II toxin-antitoxin system VapC family toxin [Chloroflexota bacterium]
MTRTVVIDASVVVAIVANEPQGPVAAATLARWATEDVTVVVPSHFWLEVTNTLLRGKRRAGADVLEAMHSVDQLELTTIEIDRVLLLSALDIAERHALTTYDAAYLAVAESTDGSLMTLDKALRSAAGAHAVDIEGRRLSEGPAPYEHEVTWPRYKGASAFLAKLRAEARDAAAG